MILDELYRSLPAFLRNPDPQVYLEDDYTVLDFEVTNKDKGSPYDPANHIVLSGWLCQDEARRGGNQRSGGRSNENNDAIRIDDGTPSDTLLKDVYKHSFLIAHNAKFELGWLKRAFGEIPPILVWDTQIAEYVIQGNRKAPLDLDSVLSRYGLGGKDHTVKVLIENGVCPSETPKEWLIEYLYKDIIGTHKLFLKQREVLVEKGLLNVFFTRCLLTPVLVEIEQTGMHLDKDRTTSVYKHYSDIRKDLRIRFNEITGGINERSSKQKREFFYGKMGFDVPVDYRGNPILTPSGEPTTEIDNILALKAKNKEQAEVLALMKDLVLANSMLDKNLASMLACVEENNGILNFNYNQTVTGTHRLSSSGKKYGMQGQNLPRDLKPCFSARKNGWKVGEIDYAQLEYRVAVFLGQDKAGMRSIQEKVDRHSITAFKIYGATPGQAGYKDARTRAKPHTFKPLYGGSSGSRNERAYYDSFKKEHVGITSTQERWKNEVLHTGSLRIASGLVFYFPGTEVKHSGFVTNSQAICNYPVQSLATADIVPIAIIYQHYLMKAADMKSFLVNTIHDSSESEIAPGEEELFEDIAVYSFVDCVLQYLTKVYGIDFNVPLDVEITIKDYWADSEEWKNKYLH